MMSQLPPPPQSVTHSSWTSTLTTQGAGALLKHNDFSGNEDAWLEGLENLFWNPEVTERQIKKHSMLMSKI
jgi:hypothetical protein